MPEQTPRREADTNWVSAAYAHDRGRLYLALVLLLVALAVVVVRDREFWLDGADTSVAEQPTPEWNPNTVLQAPVAPAAPAKKQPVAKSSAQPTVAAHSVIATRPAVLPPLEVEVVAGDTRGTVHLGSSPVKAQMPFDSTSGGGSTIAEQAPATFAAERVQMSLDEPQDKTTEDRTQAKTQARPQPFEVSYPALGRQMKVQGSVLLQAFIGADGFIRNLRVLSGPAILAEAAREAASRWQFKPYLQNGRPVETQATISVNFTIKVLNNGARDQTETVVARGGE
jgi:TonB family protein